MEVPLSLPNSHQPQLPSGTGDPGKGCGGRYLSTTCKSDQAAIELLGSLLQENPLCTLKNDTRIMGYIYTCWMGLIVAPVS